MDTLPTVPEHHQITVIDDSQRAAALLGEIAAAYEEVYREPPYEEDEADVADFVGRYRKEILRPGFRLAVSRGETGEVSGFAYGLKLSAESSWWQGLLVADRPAEFLHEDGHRTFVVMELAVRRPYRRAGLARALHDELVRHTDTERVTLAVRPEAVGAVALYSALGYQPVGLSRPWEDAPTYELMVRGRRRTPCRPG